MEIAGPKAPVGLESDPIEPDWELLRILLTEAENWMLEDDEYGIAELESLALLYNMLFTQWNSDAQKGNRNCLSRREHLGWKPC
jgi:hypothetical protein